MNVKKNITPHKVTLRERIYSIYQQIGIVYLFLHIYVVDGILILKNISNDTKKYNLKYSTILFNALIKYPMIGFCPSNFFMYKLYKNSYKEYLSFFPGVNKVIKINRHMPDLLDNKLVFKRHIQEDLTTPGLIAYYDYRKKDISRFGKPKSDKVVIKPLRGMWGSRIKIINSNELDDKLIKCSESCIVEDFIEQHHFLNEIFSGSVNTLRILTLKQTDGEIFVINAILRSGRISTNHLDNIAQGGMSINLDMDLMRLGKGYTFYEYGHEEYTLHPDTNFEFYMKTMPFFKEAMLLAKNAHKRFPMFTLIGWDIAITENGPTIVEGNRIPDLSLHQVHLPLKKPLSFLKT